MDELSGKRHFRVTVRWPASLSIAYILKWRAELFGIYPLITPPWVRTFMAEWAYTTKKAEEELGYRPMPFEEAMRITYNWIVEQRC